MAFDVDRDDSVADALATAGPVDVLINNAGFGLEGAIETVPLEEVRRMFETNVFGAARMIQAFVPAMLSVAAGRSSTWRPRPGSRHHRSAATTRHRSSPLRRCPSHCISKSAISG